LPPTGWSAACTESDHGRICIKSVIAAISGGRQDASMAKKRFREMPASRQKTVAFLAMPNAQILDVTGPFQVFVRANKSFLELHDEATAPYRVQLLSSTPRKSVQTNCGLAIAGAEPYRKFRGAIDTLLVAGGSGVEEAAKDKELLAWLRTTARSVRRIGSVCTGAYLLAAAGLLDGKRATTHWQAAADLAQKFKFVDVDPDPIYVRDGNTYTSAGVTAGMDLALALVEEDLGAPVALKVARELVLYLRRSGGQSQYSAALSVQASDRRQIEEVRAWALDNICNQLPVDALAAKAGMSPRNFARQFVRETGTTPARYVERLRVEAARRRLEESADKLEKVAADCGFGTVQSLRRSFMRVLRIPPNDYRHRFAEQPMN
jgi:transcriptional regulator GlxA family with amidase domain